MAMCGRAAMKYSCPSMCIHDCEEAPLSPFCRVATRSGHEAGGGKVMSSLSLCSLQKFITALRSFAEVGGDELLDPIYNRKGYQAHRGEQMLALGIAKYLDDLSVSGDTLGIGWYRDLHSHLVEAFVDFRTSEKWAALRKAYKIKTEGDEIPDLVEVHVGGLHRLLLVDQLARLCAVLSGELWIQPKLEAYFHAQQLCIDQAWKRFVRVGYRQLMPRIKKESHRGNKGKFGSTTLMTYCMAGRCMFTFLRGGSYQVHEAEGSTMTYVADDSDMWGVRSGPNTTATPYTECVAMINEVSDNWDLEKMRPDDKIGMTCL